MREHTDAILAALRATFGDRAEVGDAEAPDGTGRQGDGSFAKYAVVYALSGGNTMGTLATPDADAWLPYQVTCVGGSRQQAEWVRDEVVARLVGTYTLEVEQRRIPRVRLDSTGGATRDDDQTPPVWWAAPRFAVLTTPA